MTIIRKLLPVVILIILAAGLSACQNDHLPENRSNTEGSSEVITEIPEFTYRKMEEQITKLKDRYSQIRVSSFGNSLAGRKLYLLKLGSGSKKIAVLGGIHGREGITSLLTLKLLEEYAANNELGKYNINSILQETTFYFIPMLNPDGIEIAVNGITNELLEKQFYISANEGSLNFDRWKANGRGVDLNKQFNADWERVESRNIPHFESYKGSSPESEPESRALADLTRRENFSAVLAFHNSGHIIYWYYNQDGKRYKRDRKLAKKLSRVNGYKIVDPEESDPHAAGYKDWFIKEFKKPGFTIELGSGKSEKPLPSKLLSRYYRENKTVLLELADSI